MLHKYRQVKLITTPGNVAFYDLSGHCSRRNYFPPA